MRVSSSIFVKTADSMPPQAWFGVSAIFHYLGPSFAVLLFPAVGVPGVAWMRIASAALIFVWWTDPWKTLTGADNSTRVLILALGACLAAMNVSFYLALDRLPMSLVATIEFVGVVGIASFGLRSRRNMLALALVVFGVLILIDTKWSTDLPGIFFAGMNAAFFVGYIVLGHKISERGAGSGIECLGAAMIIAFFLLMPIGIVQAPIVFSSVQLVAAGIGVGVCSSVIPYICDQFAMSRLPRVSFAFLLALLPASATLVAFIVLSQIPTLSDVCGLALVMTGISIHRPSASNQHPET